MTADWNNLPPEVRCIVIDKLDFISRLNLSFCARMERQLVRSTPFKLDMIMLRSPFIWLQQGKSEIGLDVGSAVWSIRKMQPPASDLKETRVHFASKSVLVNISWYEVFTMIFNSLGTKCVAEKLVLQVDFGYYEIITWLRNNFIVLTNHVEITMRENSCLDIDPHLNWPANVTVSCDFKRYGGPLLRMLDGYDNIVKFIHKSGWYGAETVTDEQLMKLGGATHIELTDSNITQDGFIWWIKRWLVRDNYKTLKFRASFPPENSFNPNDVIKELGHLYVSSPIINDNRHVIYVRNTLTKKIGTITLEDTSVIFNNVKRRY